MWVKYHYCSVNFEILPDSIFHESNNLLHFQFMVTILHYEWFFSVPPMLLMIFQYYESLLSSYVVKKLYSFFKILNDSE